MNNSVFTTRDIVKYLIISGVIYTILKLIPSSKLMEKDLILLLSIITVGFVCLDCMFNKNNTENFTDNKPYSSCHGSKPPGEDNSCYTCDDAIAGYKAKGWAYNEKDFPQCNTRCYGAKSTDDCYTCDDVINAYKTKGWAYNVADFKQCNQPVTQLVAQPVVQPVVQPVAQPVVQPVVQPYSSCHGSKPAGEDNSCYTCDDAIKAYQAKGWAYNEKDFPQCNKPVTQSVVQPVIQPIVQPVAKPELRPILQQETQPVVNNTNTIELLKLEISKLDEIIKNLYTVSDIEKAREIKEDLLNKLKKIQYNTTASNNEIDAMKTRRMNELKNQVVGKTSNDDIAYKYYESLIVDLASKGIIDATDIDNIRAKLQSKIVTIDEVIKSLEMLKKEGKSKARQTNGKVKSDYEYSELPSDFYNPIGENIANDWDNDYTILNTNKWQVPMTRPPVCINTTPCKVCPSDSSNYPVGLKQWDDSRTVSGNRINKKWADDQSRS